VLAPLNKPSFPFCIIQWLPCQLPAVFGAFWLNSRIPQTITTTTPLMSLLPVAGRLASRMTMLPTGLCQKCAQASFLWRGMAKAHLPPACCEGLKVMGRTRASGLLLCHPPDNPNPPWLHRSARLLKKYALLLPPFKAIQLRVLAKSLHL
jgi:hypothetical protein